ncbi:MAG: ATP-binding protein, partial [Streptosporangiaceae bacterium]
MREGIRLWISQVARDSGQRLTSLEPTAIVAFLGASALGGTVVSAAGVGGTPATAVAGTFTALGTGFLAEVLSEKAKRLRERTHAEVSAEEIRDDLAGELRLVLESGGPRAQALRTDIARVLREVGAVDAAISAAVQADDPGIVNDIWEALRELAGSAAEFGWMVPELRTVSFTILEMLNEQGVGQRVVIDRLGAVEDSLRELLGHLISGSPGPGERGGGLGRLAPGDSPYLGLFPFREKDAPFFFGRTRLTAQLVGTLAKRLTGEGVLVVSGESGAGKTSLLTAGLLPALARGALAVPGSADWPRIAMTVHDHPLDELATQLAAAARIEPTQLLASLESEPEGLDRVARQALLATGASSPGRIVLVADQFERIFSPRCSEPERQAFITALSSAASRTWDLTGMPPALVILGVRGDVLVRCADFMELRSAVGTAAFLVPPMTDQEVEQVITAPATAAGVAVDTELISLLIAEFSASASLRAGGLPLLSHALAETWRQRSGQGPMSVDAYMRTGGIEASVAESAQAVFDNLTPGQQRLARGILSALITAEDDGATATHPARPADLESGRPGETPEAVATVLERFAERRLIVLGRDRVELAHESLLHSWPLLEELADEIRARDAARVELRRAAREWDERQRDRSYLYAGSRLELARRVIGDQPGPADDPATPDGPATPD